jgi:hypothetical protein
VISGETRFVKGRVADSGKNQKLDREVDMKT